MKEFAHVEWQRARRTLSSAKLLVESDPDSAVSRAYYAAFHALTAWFALRGQTFSKHSAVRAALHRELVQTGRVDREMGRVYDFLTELRETGDYGGLSHVTNDNAQRAVNGAEAFLDAICRADPELDQK